MAAAPRSDEQLLADFVAGRKAALGELARRHEQALLGAALGLVGGRRDLALDAVQESWMRVARFGHRFNGRSSFKTWAYRIVVNQCRDLMRMNDAHERASATGAENAGLAAHESVDRPDAMAERGERKRQLQRAVDSLGPEKREILLLCYHEGLTHGEAAEILEIPVGTLKSRLHAALAELREELRDES